MTDQEEKFESCKNLQQLLDAQTRIMRRHIDKHKWFRHIENKEDALFDFVQTYAWLMREIICTECCEYRKNCKMYEELSKIDENDK